MTPNLLLPPRVKFEYRWAPATAAEVLAERVISMPMSATSARCLAAELLLSREDAIAVVLAVEPFYSVGSDTICILAVDSKPLARLLAEVNSGKFVLPCSPGEILKWASRTGVKLPEDFVAHVRAQKSSATTPSKGRRARRSRLDEKGYDPVIKKEAEQIAAERWAKRLKTRKADIAKALAPKYPDLDEASLERRFPMPRR